MNLCIIKRNGDIKPFDKEKIILAISKAYHGEDIPDYVYAIADKIEAMAVESEDYLSVEEIQDNILDIDFKEKFAVQPLIKPFYL